MKKILGFLATGCLALAANSASAIPLEVDVSSGGFAIGTWDLSGPTNASGNWSFGGGSWDFDIDPGNYAWHISGFGAGPSYVSWSLRLDGGQIFSGVTGGLFGFHISEDRRFVAVPEPGTLGLLGLGLWAVGFAARRRSGRSTAHQV
jgi:hypothetical protein